MATTLQHVVNGLTEPSLNILLKGRTDEQQKVIKYFKKPVGCFSKNITDEEYDALVQRKVESMGFKQKALDKIGLDETQVNEIEPVHFENYYGVGLNRETNKDRYWPTYLWVKRGIDGKLRTNAYQVSWLFFSNKQVYVYQFTLNLNEDGKNERTEEYFYKDITNFSTTSDSAEQEEIIQTKGCLGIGAKTTIERKNLDTDRFALIVPGDKFFCELVKNDYSESRIQAMKAKLREKKG
jgi:hypothetical protein